MMTSAVMTACLLALTLSPALSASLSSLPDPGSRHKRLVPSLNSLQPKWRPSSIQAILELLREKCRQWRAQGDPNLPFYCYTLLNSPNDVSRRSLEVYYDRYLERVSPAERLRDQQRLRARGNPSNSPAIRRPSIAI